MKSITRAKGKEGNKETSLPRRIELDRVRFLFYAHCRLCSSNSSVRHPGIRIFTRSNWKLHFPSMPPAFPYSLVLSFSYDSFCFDRRYSFFVSAAPFIARILLLRFYRSTPFFAARHCFSQSYNFSFDAFFQLFPIIPEISFSPCGSFTHPNSPRFLPLPLKLSP